LRRGNSVAGLPARKIQSPQTHLGRSEYLERGCLGNEYLGNEIGSHEIERRAQVVRSREARSDARGIGLFRIPRRRRA
jgi:hypothetical protein